MTRSYALTLRWLAAAGLICGAPLATARGAGEVLTYTPTPSGTVRFATPTLSWPIVPDRETEVQRVVLTVNGTEVRARYSAAEGRIAYTPSRPLQPGLYRAHCRVTVRAGRSSGSLEKDWSFTVSEDALDALPQPDSRQKDTLEIANGIRRRLLLPGFTLSPRLCASAGAHSTYLRLNRAEGHEEVAGRPGFTGEDPGTRIRSFDYQWMGYGEDVAHIEHRDGGMLTPSLAVRELVDAPYHRLPFTDPRLSEIGSGHDGGYFTLNFGTTERNLRKYGSVVYPVEGQKDVPLAFTGGETPDPLRVARVKAPSGYILSYFAFLPRGADLKFGEITLTNADGEAVPFYLNTPESDDKLKSAVLIIPKRPLRPRTTYHARVEAKLTDGTSLARKWSFTTAAG